MAQIISLRRDPTLSQDDLSGIYMLVGVLSTLTTIDWAAPTNDEGQLYVHLKNPSGAINLFLQQDADGQWEVANEGSYPFPMVRDQSLGKVAGMLAAHEAMALAHRAGKAADIVSPTKLAMYG